MEFSMRPIAHIRSDFATKFGVPRQSGLVESLEAEVVFTPEFRSPEALRGIEGFSHLWLIWVFDQSVRETWSPTVRPPRLGGNRRVGVFATRSPFRPNPIGLSSVELEGVRQTEEGPVLRIRGADLADGTPILDIKPYIATDCHPGARTGFAARADAPTLEDTLDDVRRLEALAEDWAGEHPSSDPVELVVNYLCGARYGDPLWSLVLGGENQEFNDWAEQSDGSLASLRSLKNVTLPTGETVDFLHLVAAAGAGYGYGIPQIICTWGGDCVQLAASVRGMSQDAAACYEALSASFAAADGTGYFPLSDWLADLDGVALGQRLLAGEALSDAMEGYYVALAEAAAPAAVRSEGFVALQFGGADTGDAETFRALVWDTFFTDAGVQLYLLANEYAGVNDENQTGINADMQAPLEAACMLVADRLAADLDGAVVDPPAATPAPDSGSSAAGQETAPPEATPVPEEAEGLWAAVQRQPGILLAAMGVLAAALVAVLVLLWRISRR